MVATTLEASNLDGVTVAASTHGYCPPATGALVLGTSFANGSLRVHKAGTFRRLRGYHHQGNRTSSSPVLDFYIDSGSGPAAGNQSIALPSGASWIEDTTNSDTVSAGDLVAFHVFGGSGGSTNHGFTIIAIDFEASDGTTVTYLMRNGALAHSTASETAYAQPAAPAEKTTTQANGEWKVRLPSGKAASVTYLFVRVSGNTRTTDTTFDLVGATGSGTAPSVTIAGSSGATSQHNSSTRAFADGDQVAVRSVTGTGTGTLTTEVVAVAVESSDGVSFLVAGRPAGTTFGTNNHRAALGGRLINNATEARAQLKLHTVRELRLATVYVSSANAGGTFTLRDDTADTALAVATSNGSAGWTADTTNTVTTDTGSFWNWNFTRTATPTVHCIAVTTLPAATTVTLGKAAETDDTQLVAATKLRVVGDAAENDSATSLTVRKQRLLELPVELDAAKPVTLAGGTIILLGPAAEHDAVLALSRRKHSTLTTAGESNAAHFVAATKRQLVAAATTSEQAQHLAVAKQRSLGVTFETDAAELLAVRKRHFLGGVTETDAAKLLTAVKRRLVAHTTTLEQSLSVFAAKRSLLGVAVELDAAEPITFRRLHRLGLAAELDTAFVVSLPARFDADDWTADTPRLVWLVSPAALVWHVGEATTAWEASRVAAVIEVDDPSLAWSVARPT